MPRATWKGFLRLSLVSCPIYLMPAATKAKSIRLHQVWVPRQAAQPHPELDDDEPFDEVPASLGKTAARSATSPSRPAAVEPPRRSLTEPFPESRLLRAPPSAPTPGETVGPASRIALQPISRDTGETIAREQVVKGYEVERGHYVTFTPSALKALDVESTHTIDLTTFVPRAEVDPLYFDSPYYVYPDGRLAIEAFGVIGAAMASAGMAGLGRVTIARRERLVFVEPRDAGMVLITLRSADEVRAAEFAAVPDTIDTEAVAVAEAIIKRRVGSFEPSTFRDRYQDALKELVEAKLKGQPPAPQPHATPAPVFSLMAALKRSLKEEAVAEAPKPKSRISKGDRRQRNLLLPVKGGQRPTAAKSSAAAPKARRRKKA